MNKSLLLFLLILVFLHSCNLATKKPSKSRLFSNYLSEVHHIPDMFSYKYYVILPSFGCKGCMIRSFPELIKFIRENNPDDFAIIIDNPDIVDADILEGLNIFFDKEDVISNIAIKISGITIIKVLENNNIKFFYIENEDFNEVFLKQFLLK